VVTKFTATFNLGSSAFCPWDVCSFHMIMVIRSHYLLIQYQATIPNTAYDTSKTNTECGIVQIFGYPENKWCKTHMCHWIQDYRFKHSFQREEDHFHQQIGLKCKEGAGEMLYLA